jgi:hypothetical protein
MKKNRTNTYTYFAIKGNFNPDVISGMLDIIPEKKWNIGDKRRSGSEYDFSMWCSKSCDKDTLCIDEQCIEVIETLKDKVDILNEIRKKYDVKMILSIVPSIYNCVSPSISFDREIIEFCYLTGTEIDIDMYVY